METLSELCVHARKIAGSAAGRVICRAVTARAAVANDSLIELLEHYARDPDPHHETVHTSSSSDQGQSVGDLRTAGMNCTRGQVAEAIGDVLFAQPRYADRMLPTIALLADDPVMAVRTQATIPITALLNTHPDVALDHAERIFSEPTVDVYAPEPAAHLLTYAILRAPHRFAPHLIRALNGPHQIAERAGFTWVVAIINDSLDQSITTDPATLPAPARQGIADTLAREPGLRPDLLVAFFDDPDPEVRNKAAHAIRQLDELTATTTRSLASSFVES